MNFHFVLILSNGWKNQRLLYLAGIFHDIAKGRGGDHSDLGSLDAREFGKLHKLSDFDTKLIGLVGRKQLIDVGDSAAP